MLAHRPPRPGRYLAGPCQNAGRPVTSTIVERPLITAFRNRLLSACHAYLVKVTKQAETNSAACASIQSTDETRSVPDELSIRRMPIKGPEAQ